MSFEIPTDVADRLIPCDAPVPTLGELRHAAVVALLHPTGPHRRDPRLVFIERSSELRSHAGQVAFPGGKPEPSDTSLLDTALREAQEEVGLEPERVVVEGRLDPVPTPSGFLIIPYVGWASHDWEPRATSPEVQAILTPGCSQLADPSVHRIAGSGIWKGHRYTMHEFAVHDPPIWGATATMVWDLFNRIGWAPR